MRPQTVHLFVFDSLADWEASYAIAGINSPAMPAAAGRYQVQTVGLSHAPVTTMGGVRILPDLALEELEPAASALLIVPGGTRWDAGELSEVMPVVARFLAAGVPVAAICGATAGLARAGLLDRVRHTSNAAAYLQATGYAGAALYQEAGVVEDGGIITAGATGALEFAAQIFRRLDLYPEAVTESWYQLFKTGDPAHVARLMVAARAAVEE
ncbi:MAG: type 1 glutamine amidotransferase family protein [Chloroflexi bacterium OHK40]